MILFARSAWLRRCGLLHKSKVMKLKLLLIEDEEDIAQALSRGLHKRGYAVDWAPDGTDGWTLYQINQYDLIILDLNLPGLSGMEVLQKIRAQDEEIKVLILSARYHVDDKVLGLNEGANDYMVKPFHFAELEARIRALLSRRFSRDPNLLVCGDLSMDTACRKVAADGQILELTAKEISILEYLLRNQDHPVSAEELLEHIWDSEADLFSNAIKVHISVLRKKIGDACQIVNIRGIGYQLQRSLPHEIL